MCEGYCTKMPNCTQAVLNDASHVQINDVTSLWSVPPIFIWKHTSLDVSKTVLSQ